MPVFHCLLLAWVSQITCSLGVDRCEHDSPCRAAANKKNLPLHELQILDHTPVGMASLSCASTYATFVSHLHVALFHDHSHLKGGEDLGSGGQSLSPLGN